MLGGHGRTGNLAAGTKTHMGCNQEACDAECAALASGAGNGHREDRRNQNGPRTSPTHRRLTMYRTDGLEGACPPRPGVRAPGKETYNQTNQESAWLPHILVPPPRLIRFARSNAPGVSSASMSSHSGAVPGRRAGPRLGPCRSSMESTVLCHARLSPYVEYNYIPATN